MRHPILGPAARPLWTLFPLSTAELLSAGRGFHRPSRVRSGTRRRLRARSLPALTLALVALLGAALSQPAAAAGGGLAPAGSVTAAAAGTPALALPSYALAPDVAAAPYGTAVAISGDTAAVTGRVGTRAVVFVFFRSSAGWAQQAALADPAGSDPASVFGNALAVSGDSLAIGAGSEEAAVSSVYVYTRAGGAWSLQSHLQPGRAAELGFGAALALDGDTLVVGVPGSRSSEYSSAAGEAFVYVRAGAGWVRQAVLSAKSPASADRYGRSVAIAHQHVVVGGPGFAEIFEFAGPSWRRTAVFQGGGAGTAFGSTVAASGETVAVADPLNRTVSLFIHTAGGWFLQAEIAPPAGSASTDEFGSAIALSQDALAVGAPGTAGGAAGRRADVGAVYVYLRLRHRWLLDGGFALSKPPAGERFGSAVAITLHAALVGSNTSSPVPTAAWVLDGLDHP
jgi:hypothetical protein